MIKFHQLFSITWSILHL